MKFLSGVLIGWLLLLLAAALVLGTGSFNVSAANPPGKLEEALARLTLNRSVARRAPDARNPVPPTAAAVRDGLAHYKENCLGCHGAPGVEGAEFGQGLNPPAPDLTLRRVLQRSDGQLYWIVSNGLRMTGMPAFAPTHKPEEIWKIVVFLRHLPEVTAEEQKQLSAAMEGAREHEDDASRSK